MAVIKYSHECALSMLRSEGLFASYFGTDIEGNAIINCSIYITDRDEDNTTVLCVYPGEERGAVCACGNEVGVPRPPSTQQPWNKRCIICPLGCGWSKPGTYIVEEKYRAIFKLRPGLTAEQTAWISPHYMAFKPRMTELIAAALVSPFEHAEQVAVTTAAWERAVKNSVATLAMATAVEGAARQCVAAAEAAAAVYRDVLADEENKKGAMDYAKALMTPPTRMEWDEMDEEAQEKWCCYYCDSPALKGSWKPGYACSMECAVAMGND